MPVNMMVFWVFDDYLTKKLKNKLSHSFEVVIFHDEENTMSGSIGYCSKKPDIKAFIELHVNKDQF